jgi:hypothetical protein
LALQIKIYPGIVAKVELTRFGGRVAEGYSFKLLAGKSLFGKSPMGDSQA